MVHVHHSPSPGCIVECWASGMFYGPGLQFNGIINSQKCLAVIVCIGLPTGGLITWNMRCTFGELEGLDYHLMGECYCWCISGRFYGPGLQLNGSVVISQKGYMVKVFHWMGVLVYLRKVLWSRFTIEWECCCISGRSHDPSPSDRPGSPTWL